MNIAMSCTRNWYKYLVVDIYSLLHFNKSVKKLYLFLEDDNISDVKYLDKIQSKFNIEIEIINTNNILNNYLHELSPNRDTEYSNLCFTRLILADYINEDKIIYLDTDTIVRRDISRLWDIDITDYYVAGVKDYGVYDNDYIYTLNLTGKYINSGVVLFNLKKIREDNIIPKWFEIANSRKLLYPDQDTLNIVCTDKELYIPSMYNFINNVTLEVLNKPLTKIFHYAGPKEQWLADRFYSEEWYDSEEMFYNDIIKD